MSLRSNLKKVAAAVVAATTLFAVGVSTANALQDGGTTLSSTNSGAIYIHKRATTAKSTVTGTGKVQTAAGRGLNGVDFLVYKLDTSKVEGQATGTAALTATEVSRVNSKAKADSLAAEYGFTGTPTTVKTSRQAFNNESGAVQPAEDGVAKFDVTANGYYLIVEYGKGVNGDATEDGTNVIDGVTYEVAVATVVAMPYASEKTDAAGTYDYLTNVNIYPKNVEPEEPGKVKKTQLTDQDVSTVTAGPNQLVSNGDKVAYDLKLVFNRTKSDETSYIGDKDITGATIVDNLPTAQVPNNDGTGVETRSVFSVTEDAEVSLIKSDGTLETLTTGDYTYGNKSTVEATPGWTPTLTWTLTNAGMTKVNTKLGDNFVYKGIQVRVKLTATADLQHASSLVNKSSGTVKTEEGDKEQKGDEVTSPIAGLNLVKTDNAGTVLSGAKFQLSKTYNANSGTALGPDMKINDAQLSGTNGVLAFGDLAKIAGVEQSTDLNGDFSADNATIADFATDAANRGNTKYFKFYAYETAAPTGYQLSEFPVAVVLAVSVDANGKVTVTQEDTDIYTVTGKVAEADEENDARRVINYKPGDTDNPFRLPNTGGVGTVLLTLAGVALIVFAVVFLRRRRNEEER